MTIFTFKTGTLTTSIHIRIPAIINKHLLIKILLNQTSKSPINNIESCKNSIGCL